MKEWVCHGTNCVTVCEDSSNRLTSTGEAMITAYSLQLVTSGNGTSSSPRGGRLSWDRDDSFIHLVMTDGTRTFYGKLDPKEIKHNLFGSDQDAMGEMVSIIIHNDDIQDTKFIISYERIDRGIVISIRKKIDNLVRPVWKGDLKDIADTDNDSLPTFLRDTLHQKSSSSFHHLSLSTHFSEPSPASSGLAFSLLLGGEVAKLRNEIAALKKQKQKDESNAWYWKSTCDKIMNEWEREKSELTANFLTLFNEHKARHLETVKELESLKTKRHRMTAYENEKKEPASSRVLVKDREGFVDDEEGHDYAVYDRDYVARLAAGPVSKKTRQNHYDSEKKLSGTKVEKIDSNPSARDIMQMSQSSAGFRNPHTGALELTNLNDLPSSEEDEADV
mmetsp:Transcript_15447/g.32643  ORF Transcript_15447/g.32643 Transcript_15447/m.32643 type:complete len:390 (-) Transcript_15447:102-1271(-)